MTRIKEKAVPASELERRNAHPVEENLVVDLESVHASIRRQAARNAVRQPHAASALIGRLMREENTGVREVLLSTLVRIEDLSAVDGIQSTRHSQKAQLQRRAAKAIQNISNAAIVSADMMQVLRSLLNDRDPAMRVFASGLLESPTHADAERWLIELLQRETQVNVCASAVDLLCEVGTEAATDMLLQLKSRFADSAYIQLSAGMALERIQARSHR